MQFSRYIGSKRKSFLFPAVIQPSEPVKYLFPNSDHRTTPYGIFQRKSGSLLLSHAVPSIVPSAAQGLTIVFGMGTGVSPERIATRRS